MKTKVLIIICATMVGLYSCSKTKIDNPIPDKSPGKSNMLKFDSFDEFKMIWDGVLSDSPDNTKSILRSQYSYASFAEELEEFYDNIDWESFTSSEELLSFVNTNQNYFSIMHNAEGEMVVGPALSNNLMRMFINEERLFQIGDTVLKVFENVTIGTNSSNTLVLKEISEMNIAQAIGNGDVYIFSENDNTLQFKDWAHNCGIQQSTTAHNSSDNERVNLTITVAYLHVYDPVPGTNQWTHYSIKGYRKSLGVWFNVGRTINGSIKIATGYYIYNSDQWVRRTGTAIANNVSTKNFSGTLHTEWTSIGYTSNPISHFDGYDCWGKIPATPNAVLQCNTHLVN
jgi:hypothetical protein